MRWALKQPGRLLVSALLMLICALGCSRSTNESREARDRYLRRAFAAKEAQDIDGAIRWCEKALEKNPKLALAHRELGLMLDNYHQDYVGALYHYRRYLELRPETKNREAVEELIGHCRLAFAAQIAESPDEIKRDLKARDARIRELELEVARLRPPRADEVVMPPPVGEADPDASAPAPVHAVQAGENLAMISMRYYGTPANWKKIFDANRDRLTDANNLRVGVRLTIPPE